MPNGYEPQNAFEGIVITELQNIKEQFKALPCKESFNKINKNTTDIANIKGRGATWITIIGIIASGITTGVILFIKYLMQK